MARVCHDESPAPLDKVQVGDKAAFRAKNAGSAQVVTGIEAAQ